MYIFMFVSCNYNYIKVILIFYIIINNIYSVIINTDKITIETTGKLLVPNRFQSNTKLLYF